jgi:hypothetical protein
MTKLLLFLNRHLCFDRDVVPENFYRVELLLLEKERLAFRQRNFSIGFKKRNGYPK